MRTYVIVGTGVAGIAAAEAIREQDPSGQIVLIGDERYGFYSRPGLAYYLTGEVPEDQLYPYLPRDFRRLGLRQINDRVVSVEANEHRITLSTGQTIRYDRLLLATGAQASPLNVPGHDLEGVIKFDTLEDTREIIQLARRARTAVVVGGGITALEIVEGLRARGVRTHYFLRGERYWGNVLDSIESKIIEQRLEKHGVQIHYHTELAEILGKKGRVNGVRTKDGRVISCEIVGIAIGVRPRIELAVAAGLAVDRGILVDERLRTSVPDIYAAGDVAQVYDPISGRNVLETLWEPARQEGRAAGRNMAGSKVIHRKELAFNVARLADLTTTLIGTVGRPREDEDLIGIAHGDSETWRELPDAIAAQDNFDINRLRIMVGEHTLIGAIVMGDQTLSRPLHTLIVERADITTIRDQLLAPGAPLAEIIADFWVKWKNGSAAQ